MTRFAFLVAHGAPSDPAPQEAALAALAAAVAPHLPGWRIGSATLAMPGALEAAVAAHPGALVYPFFMAEGWFTGTHLPERLARAGAPGARILTPFGADPELVSLIARVAETGATDHGLDPNATTLLIAAHGSQRSRRSADTTHALVAALRASGRFAAVTCGFVEETPFLAEAARLEGPALCLPFFALTAGHVVDDVPEALDSAGFAGPLLPPIGAHPEVPALIARALAAAA